VLSALAAVATRIGLMATASTTCNESFHIARKFDHISGGRAGRNIVTSWFDAEARNVKRDRHLGYTKRYERAAYPRSQGEAFPDTRAAECRAYAAGAADSGVGGPLNEG
jgi:Luciferase-like monooxygenase